MNKCSYLFINNTTQVVNVYTSDVLFDFSLLLSTLLLKLIIIHEILTSQSIYNIFVITVVKVIIIYLN